MPDCLASELGRRGLISAVMTIEAYASGCNPDLDAAKGELLALRRVHDQPQLAIAGIECGTLSRADAQRLCGWSDEPAPETLRASCPVTIPPPEPTVPGTDIEETA